MAKDLVTKRTRREFREWLVGWTLRTIQDLFEAHDVEHVPVPAEHLPAGQRRGLVEEYYTSVRWDDPGDVRRVLNAYEEILDSVDDSSEGKQNLVRCLERDGYTVEQNRIKPGKLHEQFAVVLKATDRIDLAHLESYIDRIRHSVDLDPELAIGSTKELLEATLKTILEESRVAYDKSDDVPKLLRAVQKELDLVPSGLDESKKGGDIIRRVLSSIGTIVIGVGELRISTARVMAVGAGVEESHPGTRALWLRWARPRALSYFRLMKQGKRQGPFEDRRTRLLERTAAPPLSSNTVRRASEQQ